MSRPMHIAPNLMYAQDPYLKEIINITRTEAVGRHSETDRRTRYSGPVHGVNLLPLENAKHHHTDLFHNLQYLHLPIFRRGQPISLVIEFNQSFQLADNNLRLDFTTGHPSHQTQESLIHLNVTNATEFERGKNWSVRKISGGQQSLKLEVRTSAACPIGLWRMSVVTGREKTVFNVPGHFYILFNPWCPDDDVFMDGDDRRFEYVLNKDGCYFEGKSEHFNRRAWQFDQFFPATLATAILCLAASPMKKTAISSPIDVCRALSYSAFNFILEGRWAPDGQYPDGTAPWMWPGSLKIFQIFMDNLSHVKYGQCWVFAGITCSLARVLGLPCRVVTNFDSAHDTDRDLVIDAPRKYFRDSVWNYHVWNEAWMVRPDLPSGYGGWQAFDGTGQEPTEHEENEKIFICGPSSVKAIKLGEISQPYDSVFIYSEVNADVREWFVDQYDTNKRRITGYYTNHVGKMVLTKRLGSFEVEDLVEQYKFREGMDEERQSYTNALRVSGIKNPEVPSLLEEDVFFKLGHFEYFQLGQPITIKATVENRGNKTYTITLYLGADLIMYTGTTIAPLNASAGTANDNVFHKVLVMAPNKLEEIRTTVPPEQYLHHIANSNHIRSHGKAFVNESHQAWQEEHCCDIVKPKLLVEMPDQLKIGTPVTVKISFKNPLQSELRDCKFVVQADCQSNEFKSDFRVVKPQETVFHQIQMTPKYEGPCSVVAIFNSNILTGLIGSKKAHCS